MLGYLLLYFFIIEHQASALFKEKKAFYYSLLYQKPFNTELQQSFKIGTLSLLSLSSSKLHTNTWVLEKDFSFWLLLYINKSFLILSPFPFLPFSSSFFFY